MKRTIKAVIFDLDGVLVRSEELWEQMGRMYLEQKGVTIPKDFGAYVNRHCRGAGQRAINIVLKKKFGLTDSLKKMYDERLQMVLRVFKKKLEPMAYARSTVERLAKTYPLALVSSSPQPAVDLCLKILKLRPYFRVILTEKDVQEVKPNPYIFIKAAKRLHLPPASCLVIEDSIAGVTAAHRAHMSCVLLKTYYTTASQSRLATRSISRLNQITPTLIQSI